MDIDGPSHFPCQHEVMFKDRRLPVPVQAFDHKIDAGLADPRHVGNYP